MSGRPETLFALFASLEALDGVGPKTARHFSGLGVAAPRDLIFLLPYSVIDRRLRATIDGLSLPTVATLKIRVGKHDAPRNKGAAYRVSVTDQSCHFHLVFFHARGDYLQRVLPEGGERIVSGKLEVFDGLPQMVHPDYIVSVTEQTTIPGFEPIYPLTSGISQKVMFKAVQNALTNVPHFDEWIDQAQLDKAKWPSFFDALHRAHAPQASLDLLAEAPARERLAYDELFAHQLTLALARNKDRSRVGCANVATSKLTKSVTENLPYELTSAQKRAIGEITADMATNVRMNRLLQGDVGAGKTLVAFLALLTAVEAGGQGVLMAPTEILAQQHFAALKSLADAAGVTLEVLTGRDKGRERDQKLDRLATGQIDVLVGTHAVFQANVVFSDLRLAVIDEQHRFGVRQRLELGKKGRAPDVLVMTATPIPRSLALSQYGDLDVSVLDQKPPGRQPIKTALVSAERIDEVIERLRAAVLEGRQCYWVCPLVEESETSDLTAAEARFQHLRAALGEEVVGLVHGQMPTMEKDSAMSLFQSGVTKILVATTVIEVGVDVPNASIMVIERAETFGLAQLHQLRGRVGRGALASTCLLMYRAPLSENGRQRLSLLRDTEDGFVIAETDLQMRGAGDMIGTAQSGMPKFQIADVERQTALMAIAQSDARRLLHDDPVLKSSRGEAARVLLWLMRRDDSIRLISVG